MLFVDIPTIIKFWDELNKMRLTNSSIDSHFPGGTFFIHSVRNPLTSLQLNLDEIERADNKEKVGLNIKNAKLAVKQINQLVNSIPQINKLSCGHDKANVEQTIRYLKSMYQSKDKTHQLIFNIKLKSCEEMVKLNQLYFYELLSCLINNAFDSYHPRTKDKLVIVTVLSKRKKIYFQVQDFGKGVNKLELVLMTQNGFSKKKKGVGFGMWFVKKIVEEQLGSKLKIRSDKGHGTIIKFSLPLV